MILQDGLNAFYNFYGQIFCNALILLVLDRDSIVENTLIQTDQKLESVGLDKIELLKRKKSIIKYASEGSLQMDEETWNFITSNKVEEIFYYLIIKYAETFNSLVDFVSQVSESYYTQLVDYMDVINDDRRIDLLYSSI